MKSFVGARLLAGMSLVWLAHAQGLVQSEISLAPEACLQPVVMSSCGAFYEKLTSCSQASNTAAAISCYCPQSVFDILAGCRQEWWNCWRTSAVDTLFLGSDGLFAAWSTVCADVSAFDILSYTLTTMSITTPLIVEETFCEDVVRDCNSLTVRTSSCLSQFGTTANDARISCLCDADMLYLASRCDIDGSVSCLLQTPISSSLYSYLNCRNVGASTSGGRTTSSTTSAAGEDSTATSTYSPAAPSQGTSGETGAIPTTNSGGGSLHVRPGHPAEVAFVVAVAVLVA